MIRILILFGFLLAATVAQAEETTNKIDVRLLMSLPEKRHVALVLNVITAHDSTPDIGEKREKYYDALKQIAQKLRDQYYCHDEFPSNVFAGIEDRADVLVAARYPLSNATGCSHVDYLRDSYRIEMAEETVTFMAKSILDRIKDGDNHLAGNSAPIFSNWNEQWKEAGKVPDGPNQNLAEITKDK